MSFAGQAIWITGASSGIGAALARALAAQGARLVLSGRRAEALEAVRAHVVEAGAEALVLPFEVTHTAALPGLVERAESWSGGVDCLINNAGISQRSLAVETAYAVYERIVAVDLLAPIALTQALLPAMVARGRGRIVMMSSVAGKVGVPLRSAYSAAKFGLIGYADALRSEVAGHGVAVQVICPGSIRTDVSRNALTADGSPRMASDQAIDEGLDPDESAAAMLAALLAGTREIIHAAGVERAMGELRRTPDQLMDQMATLVANGYAAKMKAEA